MTSTSNASVGLLVASRFFQKQPSVQVWFIGLSALLVFLFRLQHPPLCTYHPIICLLTMGSFRVAVFDTYEYFIVFLPYAVLQVICMKISYRGLSFMTMVRSFQESVFMVFCYARAVFSVMFGMKVSICYCYVGLEDQVQSPSLILMHVLCLHPNTAELQGDKQGC